MTASYSLTFSPNSRHVCRWLAVTATAAVAMTSSYDIFLNLNLGPTLRIAQLFMIILIALAVLKVALTCKLKSQLGVASLLCWWITQVVFIPASEYWQKSVAYCAWLLLNIAFGYALVQLLSDDEVALGRVLKLYVLSFIITASFGLLQFVLPIFGGPGVLVTEWWLPGRVARINGFSYEPSYFATYLIMGLVMLGSLRRSGVLAGVLWKAAYLTIVAALLLCSSRIGYIFLLLDVLSRLIARSWNYVRRPANILGATITPKRIVAFGFIFALLSSTYYVAYGWAKDNFQVIEMLSVGTGLFGTPAHSVDERSGRFNDTLDVFLQHPILGRSLGGITEAIAKIHGVAKPLNFADGKPYEGQSVFLEVLAASGLIGIVPFLIFLVRTVREPLRLSRLVNPFYSEWLKALVKALVAEWAILQFNQNVLRLSLWTHIAILTTVFAAARRSRPATQAIPASAGLVI